MLKVLFYHANDAIGLATSEQLYLGVAALYLKTWIEQNRPDLGKQIHWCLPVQKKLTDDQLISLLNTEQPDIFCSSHYIWNHSFISEQLLRIKPMVSNNISFVAGGPSIDVNIDPDFFKKHSFVDYAIYGAGEVAFADIVESKIKNKKLIAFNTSNVAWFDQSKQKTVVADFKYVPQLSISPYTSNEELFSKMVRAEQNSGVSLIIPYDLTRGCPYSCTFCDWNSGLTNKTTRRKGSYEAEIDLFVKLKIKNIYLSDANVGQYQEDIDMISYLAKKNIEDGAGFTLDGNFSKLRKENNLKIYHIMAQGDLLSSFAGFTISVQDVNPGVLKNIDRPDVGWSVHLEMINELRECYPHLPSKIQLIQGLPGQTVDSWRKTLGEICRNNLLIQIFISELLPASPAARDYEYQQKFNFAYSNSERFNGTHYFRGTFPESCVSFTKEDFVTMTVLSHLYTALMIVKFQSTIAFDVEKVVDYFINTPEYKNIKDNLYTNWVTNDKFYYTMDLDGKIKDLTACYVFRIGSDWSTNSVLIKSIAKTLGSERNRFLKDSIAAENTSLKVSIKQLEGFV